jgi:phospholipid N-methyltransferase
MLMQKAVVSGLIKGLGDGLVNNRVISLQYANNTILFVEKNEDYAKNLKVDFDLL